MLISVQSSSFTLGQTSLSLSEMGGCIWDVFLFLHRLLLSDSSCNEGHGRNRKRNPGRSSLGQHIKSLPGLLFLCRGPMMVRSPIQ